MIIRMVRVTLGVCPLPPGREEPPEGTPPPPPSLGRGLSMSVEDILVLERWLLV